MNKKIVGIFIMMLVIVNIFPIIGSRNSEVNIKLQKSTSNLPDYFNWRDFGGQDWTTPAKDQAYPKYCGCCWIFASIGALESVINIKEGSAVIDTDLSEQYILSCLPQAANSSGEGCNGGYPFDAYFFIKDTSSDGNNCNGVILETCFPYQADDEISCDEKCPEWEDMLVPITDYGYWITDESSQAIEDIKTQIMQGGPVVACMLWTSSIGLWGLNNHDPSDYFAYYEGKTGTDHDIVIIGWKDDESIGNGGYWICKNSHSSEFGYEGFFNLEFGLLGSKWIDDNPDTTYIVWVDYDSESYEWSNEPNHPSETIITGESNGTIRTKYEYTLNAVDPENHDLRYYISWGDGNWEWTDYYQSEEDVKVKHIWEDEGDFSIIALAMNSNDNIGPWGTLEISMPKNKMKYQFDNLFERLVYRFPLFEKILNQIL